MKPTDKYERILDPSYWKERLEAAKELHQSVFLCPKARWDAIEEAHRKVLAEHIQPNDRIVDLGCGYGRVVGLLPASWQGDYLGVDQSPDLLAVAEKHFPARYMDHGSIQWRLANLLGMDYSFFFRFYDPADWVIFGSMRQMIRRAPDGERIWKTIHDGAKSITKKILYLEYDPIESFSIEVIEEAK